MTTSPGPAGSQVWRVSGREFNLSRRTAVMGIVNVTPDSFSDGGQLGNVALATERALQLLSDGADIIDIGGESTRPGRPETVTVTEELDRVLPVVEALRSQAPDAVISVDTYKGEVAKQVLAAGAHIINDITSLRRSPEIAGYVRDAGAGLILMHMLGEPETMQQNPTCCDVLVDIRNFLRERIQFATAEGVPETAIAVDPGIGFGKTIDHNVEILAGLEYMRLLQRPICIGASRKGFLGKLTGDLPVADREEATIAAHMAGVLHGASIIRTHDVAKARRSLAIIDAIRSRL
ncbi:MAG: dihydropteroate synthase [Candidatus Sumerlaeaceae bacterium]